MTLGEQLRLEGRLQAKLEVARALLEKGKEIDFVVEITELSLAKVQEISATTK